jgi:NAD(P)-dependent dehydrogenase (short-subunit alcohol dehydrogenase family)
MNLKDRVAIVTGGSSGIGRALPEGLASEGSKIVVADISRSEAAAKEMNQKGFQAAGIKVDVSSPEETERMVQETVKAFGRIDVLVNNAGIYTTLNPGPFEKIPVS